MGSLSRAAGLAAVGVLALIASRGFGTPALAPLGAGLLLLAALAVTLVWLAARFTRVERTVDPPRLLAGEGAAVRVTLSGWPVRAGLVGLLDWGVDPRAEAAGPLVRMRPRLRDRALVAGWTVSPARRGEHRLPPARLELADPFGLAGRVVEGGGEGTLVVVARTVEIGRPFWEGDGGALAGAGARRPSPGWQELDGVRDYRAGDPLSRIHWPQTARRARLQTKELRGADGGGDRTLILLDASAASGPWGDQAAPFEVAVAAAASLARRLLSQADASGFEHTAAVPQAFAPGRATWAAVELALARLRPDGTLSAGAALRAAVARGATVRSVVLVSASLDPALPDAVRDARAHGANVALVLTGPAVALANDCRRAGASVRAVGSFGDLHLALGTGRARATVG